MHRPSSRSACNASPTADSSALSTTSAHDTRYLTDQLPNGDLRAARSSSTWFATLEEADRFRLKLEQIRTTPQSKAQLVASIAPALLDTVEQKAL